MLLSVFVARLSFLFRGMGHAIGGRQIHTSQRWWKHANQALEDARLDGKEGDFAFLVQRSSRHRDCVLSVEGIRDDIHDD